LPIELLYFTAECENDAVRLEWATASETNNDYFLIERSNDGLSWTSVGTVDGAGNSMSELNYSLYDVDPIQGKAYYRITQFDFDGQFERFDIISANCGLNEIPEFSVYPNPFDNEIYVQLENWTNVTAVRLFDLQGKLLNQWDVNDSNELINLRIETNHLLPGVYLVEIRSLTHNERVKLIKR